MAYIYKQHNKVAKLTVFPSLLFVLNSTNGLFQNCNLQRRYAYQAMKIILILLLLLVQGCTSNLYLSKSSSPTKEVSNQSKMVVFVTNPEHENYEVLKASGIYEITANLNAINKLTLESEVIYPRCGNPMLGAVLTLGLLPGYLDATEGFRYSLIESGVKIEYIHYLHMYQRISIWEWAAKPFKSKKKIKIKALGESKREAYVDA